MISNENIARNGEELENRVEELCKKYNIPYDRSKKGPKATIDFRIHFMFGTMYLDAKAESVPGSVQEKLVHTPIKYWLKYNYDEMFILLPYSKLQESVAAHLTLQDKKFGIKTHIIDLIELEWMLENKKFIRYKSHRGTNRKRSKLVPSQYDTITKHFDFKHLEV
tara:strand:+ start:60 stop:554 length:495 start_codon:yes stop_codon:yes gene_type:complete